MAVRVLIADDALFMRTLLKDILLAPEFESDNRPGSCYQV